MYLNIFNDVLSLFLMLFNLEDMYNDFLVFIFIFVCDNSKR